MTDFIIRHVVTIPCKDGIGRTLMGPAQGRNTHATPEEAQAWIDGYFANNSQATLDMFGRDLQVRECKCYPIHFDPMNVYFDTPNFDSAVKYEVIYRSKTTGKTDKENIIVWPGQTPQAVAERIADGYGAIVESVTLS